MKPERIQIFLRLLIAFLNELFGGTEPESYEFESYTEATRFVDAVGKNAADAKRCPEIIVHYAGLPGDKTQVLVSFNSVPAGGGLDLVPLAEAAVSRREPETGDGDES